MASYAEQHDVTTAHQVYAWSETHETIEDAPWHFWAAPGDPDADRFVTAIPTSGGLVAFHAPNTEDADRLRGIVFETDGEPTHSTIARAYAEFGDLHGNAEPEWDRDRLQAWLHEHGYHAPYPHSAVQAAYDATLAGE